VVIVSLILILLSVSIISVNFSGNLRDYFIFTTGFTLQEFAIYSLLVILLLQLFIFFRRSREATAELNRVADIASRISPDVLITTDDKGRIDFVARSVERTFGYKKDEVLGKSSGFLFDVDPELRLQPSPEIDEKSGFDVEFGHGKKKNGEIITLEIISTSSGLRKICLLRDISRRIEAQKAIDVYQNKLRALWSHLSLAEERERERISADIHDKIGQYLALSKIKLGALASSIDDPQKKTEVEEIRALVGESIVYARSLMFAMNKPVLYEIGLSEAIRALCEDFRKSHDFFCTFEDDGSAKPVGDDLSIVLYQAARELLLNVKKHADAECATVRFNREGDTVKLVVEDDGRGFDIDKIKLHKGGSKGFGLFSIAERVEYFGGSIDIESSLGAGSRIEITMPIKKETL